MMMTMTMTMYVCMYVCMYLTRCGAAAVWMATRETKRWCVPLVSDGWVMWLAGGLGAGNMGFEGCTHVESRGTAKIL